MEFKGIEHQSPHARRWNEAYAHLRILSNAAKEWAYESLDKTWEWQVVPYLQASIHTSFYIIVMEVSLFCTFLDVSSRKTRFSAVDIYFQLLSLSFSFVQALFAKSAKVKQKILRTAWMRFNVPSHACGDPFLCRRWVLGGSRVDPWSHGTGSTLEATNPCKFRWISSPNPWKTQAFQRFWIKTISTLQAVQYAEALWDAAPWWENKGPWTEGRRPTTYNHRQDIDKIVDCWCLIFIFICTWPHLRFENPYTYICIYWYKYRDLFSCMDDLLWFDSFWFMFQWIVLQES